MYKKQPASPQGMCLETHLRILCSRTKSLYVWRCHILHASIMLISIHEPRIFRVPTSAPHEYFHDSHRNKFHCFSWFPPSYSENFQECRSEGVLSSTMICNARVFITCSNSPFIINLPNLLRDIVKFRNWVSISSVLFADTSWGAINALLRTNSWVGDFSSQS